MTSTIQKVQRKLFNDTNLVEKILTARTEQDDITTKISEHFDFTFTGEITTVITIPVFPSEFNLGIIVGSSGSGKSTILKHCFPMQEIEWNNNKAIVSHFTNEKEASNRLGASGLNSIPSWLKPYSCLSTGEKFRADVARRLVDGGVIDEFTSTVNREVAKSCCVAINKYIGNNKTKRIVIASCHKDILDWLEADWIYDTDMCIFLETRRFLRQSEVATIRTCTVEAWSLFKKHHYLNHSIHKAATCYLLELSGEPVGFVALMHFTGRDIKTAWREHRVVILPDYQGRGIGNKMSEAIGQAYVNTGRRYFSKTSNPRMGEHRNKHDKIWRKTSTNMQARPSYIKPDGTIRKHDGFGTTAEVIERHAHRVCYSHEYIGKEEDVTAQKQLELFKVNE